MLTLEVLSLSITFHKHDKQYAGETWTKSHEILTKNGFFKTIFELLLTPFWQLLLLFFSQVKQLDDAKLSIKWLSLIISKITVVWHVKPCSEKLQ